MENLPTNGIFRVVFRQFSRFPGITFPALFSLILGIGITTTVFSLVNAVMLEPFPFRNPEGLVFLWSGDSPSVRRGMSGPDLKDLRSQNHTFIDIVPFTTGYKLTFDNPEPESVLGAYAGPGLFQLLGVAPVKGRVFAETDTPDVVVISYAFWAGKLGNRPDIVGKTIKISARQYEVIGVMPESFFFPDQSTALWLPLSEAFLGANERDGALFHAIGGLRQGIGIKQAKVDISTIMSRLDSEYPEPDGSRRSAGVFSIYEVVIGNYRNVLLTLLGSVLLLLLISCANVANLLLAKGVAREKELAIRGALGATRKALFLQLLTESMALALLGGLGGVALAQIGLNILQKLYFTDIPRFDSAHVDFRVLFFALIVSLLTGLIFGALPASKASKPNLVTSLQLGGTTSSQSGRNRLREVVVVLEIALAFPLLVTAVLFLSSFVRLSKFNWGFDPRHVLIVDLTYLRSSVASFAERALLTEAIMDQIKKIPNVNAVAMGYGAPLSPNWEPSQLAVNGEFRTIGWTAGKWVISADYFRSLGVPILRGREFTTQDESRNERVLIISRALADKLWPGQDPIGKKLDMLQPTKAVRDLLRKNGPVLEGKVYNNPASWESEGSSWEIVGLVGNLRMFGLDYDDDPAMYVDYRQETKTIQLEEKFIVRVNGTPAEISNMVKERIRAVSPSIKVNNILDAEELVNRSIGGRGSSKLLLIVSSVLGLSSLIVSTVGLYSLISYSLRERTHEIGLRMAVGAGRTDILWLVMKQVARITLSGLLIGIVIALMAGHILSSMLFGIGPNDTATFCLVAFFSLLISLLASFGPAREIAHLNPWTTLRQE